jgi:putative methyltransferase (TIGR04325 family)
VRYHVVDIPAMCEAGRKLWPNDPDITFGEDLPAEGERFDIVYAWGAIHYLPDPLALLRDFTRYEPKIVLFAGSPFADRAFVRAQGQPTPGAVRYPQWVISLPEAQRVMAEAGYRLAFRATDDTTYDVDNFDAEHRVGHSAMLLFTRCSA